MRRWSRRVWHVSLPDLLVINIAASAMSFAHRSFEAMPRKAASAPNALQIGDGAMNRLIAAALCAGGVLVATAAPAIAGNSYTYIHKGTFCIASGTEEQPMVQARVKVFMDGDQSGNLGFSQFLMKARLVPTTAGLNFVRPWSVQAKARANPVGESWATLWTTTPKVSADANWKVQVKMEWDRPGPKNYTKTLTYPFRGCSRGGVDWGGTAIGVG